MLAAVLVVAVVALAGVGYAVNYTGSTSNEKNTVDVMYVKLSQTGDAAYDANVSFIGKEYYNTVTDASGTEFTATGITEVTVDADNDIKAFVISKENLTLVLADSESTANKYTLTITTSENLGVGEGKISYYFGIGAAANTAVWSDAGAFANSVTTWTIDDVDEGSYKVYVAANGSTSSPPADLSNLTFNFVASAAMTA